MSDRERQQIREFGYFYTCAAFFGVVLIVVGVSAFVSDDLSYYFWPAIAIAAGICLFFRPFY